jgi:hypothetical protein
MIFAPSWMLGSRGGAAEVPRLARRVFLKGWTLTPRMCCMKGSCTYHITEFDELIKDRGRPSFKQNELSSFIPSEEEIIPSSGS